MQRRIIEDVAELRDWVRELMVELTERDNGGKAAVIGLSGELGAGKTAFTQELASHLAIDAPITSPTFVVMKQYETNNEHFTSLIHIDAYRIEDLDEMRVLRFSEILETERTIICIEWADRIAALLPPETLWIEVDINPDMTRTYTYGYQETQE